MVLAIMLLAEKQNENTSLIKQGEVDHSAGDRLTQSVQRGRPDLMKQSGSLLCILLLSISELTRVVIKCV